MEKNKFTFDEKTHMYYLDGKRMTGCTTVLGMIAKPALIGWAAKMAVEHIAKHEDPDTKGGTSVLIPRHVLEEAKTAHIRTRDNAAQKGTDIHALCEEFINIFIADFEGRAVETDTTETKENKQLRHFIDWAVKNKVKFLASEKKVYSKKHFVAGTYDFKCEIDGKVYMGDIKTSSGIYDRTPFAQCAAYQMMEAEMTGKKDVDGRLIINLKKTGLFDEDKDVYISEHYEDDLELFMSSLSIYRIMKNKFEPMTKHYKSNNKTVRI